ncbi:MAG: hypothetical protein ACOX4L_07905 [Bacillota bacterium]|jgi:hypothetical protein
MNNSMDFSKLLNSCEDIDTLLSLFCRSSDNMTDADKLRLLRVIMSFLALILKVDLKISV